MPCWASMTSERVGVGGRPVDEEVGKGKGGAPWCLDGSAEAADESREMPFSPQAHAKLIVNSVKVSQGWMMGEVLPVAIVARGV